VQLDCKFYNYQLKLPFKIAHGEYHERKALIVQLSYNHLTGFGECVEIDYYHIHLDEYVHLLASLQKKWEQVSPASISPYRFFEELDILGLPSFLKSAIDCAYWDLYGKLNQNSFLDYHHLPKSVPILSSYTVGADTAINQLKAIKNSEWPIIKVKVTHWSAEIRDTLLSSNKPIAIDANGSFTSDICQTIQEDPLSAQFLYFEQPMPKGKSNYQVLQKDGFANWMADEDIQYIGDLTALQQHYRSVNLKVMKCGGITPTLEIIKKAKSMGFQIMIGCMTESTVGISAGMSLAAFADYLDLDGANLIANDSAKGWNIKNGTLYFNSSPGLGIFFE
jgi:L-Ala-D/L-Glu epimerase